MERLTKPGDSKYVKCNINDACTGTCGSCPRNTEIRRRLKYYEDSEEQGKLVFLNNILNNELEENIMSNMNNYDPNIYNGVHTVKITLQQWDFVGHIIQKISGNCKGRNVLDFDFECEDEFPDNDCDLTYNDEYNMFSCKLKNKEGDTLECKCDAADMNKMIVGMEIIDFR